MNIIEKEKARQEDIFRKKNMMVTTDGRYEIKLIIDTHKQSLINLKEYMEEIIESESDTRVYDYEQIHDAFLDQLIGDIQELTKLIEVYERK